MMLQKYLFSGTSSSFNIYMQWFDNFSKLHNKKQHKVIVNIGERQWIHGWLSLKVLFNSEQSGGIHRIYCGQFVDLNYIKFH